MPESRKPRRPNPIPRSDPLVTADGEVIDLGDMEQRLAAAMAAPPSSLPRDPYCHYRSDWGSWLLDPENGLLWESQTDVTIDLKACITSAALLDRIFQAAGHTTGDRYVAALIRAVRDILSPQAVLCSWGEDKQLTLAEVRRCIRRAAECPANGSRVRRYEAVS